MTDRNFNLSPAHIYEFNKKNKTFFSPWWLLTPTHQEGMSPELGNVECFRLSAVASMFSWLYTVFAFSAWNTTLETRRTPGRSSSYPLPCRSSKEKSAKGAMETWRSPPIKPCAAGLGPDSDVYQYWTRRRCDSGKPLSIHSVHYIIITRVSLVPRALSGFTIRQNSTPHWNF